MNYVHIHERIKCACRCHLPLKTIHLCPNCFNGKCEDEDMKDAAMASHYLKQVWESPDAMDGPAKMDVVKKRRNDN